MTKVSQKHNGEARFKAAAAYAESGDIHDAVTGLWKGQENQKQEFIDKVSVENQMGAQWLTSPGNRAPPKAHR